MSSYYGPLRAGSDDSGGGAFLQDVLYQDDVIDPANAAAEFSLSPTGLVSGTGQPDYTWLLAGAAADYEVKADILAGSLSSGTTGSWMSLASARSWSVTRTVVGSNTCQMTVSIRRVSSGVVQTSATKRLTASVDL